MSNPVDAQGNVIRTIQGAGTAGNPAGGVVTVQGIGGFSKELLAASGQMGAFSIPAGIAYVGENGGTGYAPLGVALHVTNSSSLLYALRTPDKFKLIAVSVTSGTPVSIWTPASNKRFRLMGGGVSLSVAGYIKFEDGSGNVVWQTPMLAAGVPYNLPENFGNGILSSTVNNQLFIDVSASGTVNGSVFGTEE
jgi:hypothetical protein